MNDRKEREKRFHDVRFSHVDEGRKNIGKFYVTMRKPKLHFRNMVLKHCKESRLMEYGCGTGGNALLWAQNGAKVSGIDISGKAIENARRKAARCGLDIYFSQMDAERLTFQNDTFDVIVGTGIIHHLDLRKSFAELARVLCDNGRALFIEPLGHNWFINLYRKLTPAMRTPDEHPLLMEDIDLAGHYFKEINLEFFNLLTLMAVPFRKLPGFTILLNTLELMDKILMRIFPFIRRYAWVVILNMSKPVKNPVLKVR